MKICFYLWIALELIFWTSCSQQQRTFEYVFKQDGWNFSCPYLTSDARGHLLLTWAGADTSGKQSQVWMARFNIHSFRLQDKFPVAHTAGVYPHGENLPKLTCTEDGFWVLAFGTVAHRSSNPYAGEIQYVYSTDAGRHWSAAQPLVTDSSSHDQRYFALGVAEGENQPASKSISIIWMDDRLKARPEGSTLFFARISPSGNVSDSKPIAYQLCPCCRTAMLIDTHQVIHIAYRQILSDSIRDIMYMASYDQGKTFTQPQRVSVDNWVIRACPHSGPDMAVNAQGLHVVWYTLSHGQGIFYTHTVASPATEKHVAFAARQQVSGFNMSAKHAQIAALPDGRLVIAWDEFPLNSTTAHQRIGMQLRTADGKWIKTWYIADPGCDLQFPVLFPLGGDRVAIAYTCQQGRRSMVVCRSLFVGK